MRPERNPLDLNNFPEDYTRDGKQILEDSSSSAGYRKKKSGGKDGKDESGKVYECRFCSLKFCKSQALGGHMNRHRQERETETLNRARQIVFSNDNLIPQAPPHHLSGQPIPHGGGYHQTGNINDPFRSVYPSRLFSGSSSTMLPPPPPPPPPPAQSYMYSSPSRHMYPPHQMNDYFVGHVISGNTQYGPPDTNYTCVGAPVGHGYGSGNGNKRGLDMAVSGGRDMSLHSQDEGLNRGRNYTTVMQQRLDPSLINRYQDGF